MENMISLFHKRNVFDLTHERKFSCDLGKLVPIMVEEVLPGDTFKVETDMLVRFSPLIAPLMHRVNIFTHYFFVPNRLIWTDFEKFITGDVSGADTTQAPIVSATVEEGSLLDYLGYPIHVMCNASALPIRAYNLIYNEWFRDQNLQNPVANLKTNGIDATSNQTLLSRNWEKDYFTSCLPWPQRGSAVTVPLGTTAPVTGTASVVGTAAGGHDPVGAESGSTVDAGTYEVYMGQGVIGNVSSMWTGNNLVSGRPDVNVNSTGTISGTADLSSASAITINALRQAFQVQKWMERNARAGVRYIESILSHFGVASSDARLQRPEFLGGGKSSLVVSEVLQTGETSSTSPQGNMAGHAFSAQRSHEFTKSFEEHGWIIGIMSIMPRTAYQQGLSRRFTRSTRYDYYWPEFAHLGEQAVLRKELYYHPEDLHDDDVFGYQGRYDEYRRRESSVHGDFKSSLSMWHMGRIFEAAPTLNSSFVTADPTPRVFAVESDTQKAWVQLINKVQAIRPLPLTGEPGLIDHN